MNSLHFEKFKKEVLVMSTPHIGAKQGDIAETILLPGDPLRAKYIADNFLENPVAITKFAICLGLRVHIKEKKFLFKEQVWEFLLFPFMQLN